MSRFAFLLTLILAVTLPMTATAQSDSTALSTSPQGTVLTVSATGQSARAPDFATVSAGVITQAAQADAAMRDNAAQMARTLAALRQAGVAERDIRTSSLALNPQYRYEQNQAPVITGYQASNTVTIKMRDLSQLGRTLDALVVSGANQIHGPSFGIEHPQAAYDEARRAATQAALAQAKTYADALGVRVRRLISLSEGDASDDAPAPRLRVMAMAADASATPIASGETELSVQVTAVFELGN